MNSICRSFLLAIICLPCFSQHYKNFKVAVYCRAYEVQQMMDTANYLRPRWDDITRQCKVDKVYLETHRDLIIVSQSTLDAAKKFFTDRGVEIAGGITYTVSEPNRFETFCYSNPEHRKKVKEIAELTARNFNEMILDDFFFTNCKSDESIREKGSRSWTQYRLDLMAEAARSLVLQPAKTVNPRVKVVIKYPNWYEHFHGLGFNLEKEPALFDGIYTGTETRDAVLSAQHLQPYLGYNIFRYFSNIKPGGNGGGWVDPGGMRYLDRYAEQLWITLFAKAPECTLFDFRQLSRPVYPSDRGAWQGQQTSFDYDELMSRRQGSQPVTIAAAADYTFEKADRVVGLLGKPIGVASYRPYHSTGEDFLQNYLGMAGIPMNQQPVFPSFDSVVLLTEEAKADAGIVGKIKQQLVNGKTIVITSGLLQALQGKGIEDIVELRYTDRRALVKDFIAGRQPVSSDKAILIPQIQYLTNDSWEIVSALDGPNGWPILHEADYSKGKLYVLVIPDNFADLYHLPAEVLNVIRRVLGSQLNLVLEGPAQVSLFVYDNNTCIVESFLNEPVTVRLVAKKQFVTATDLETNTVLHGEPRKAQTGWWMPKSEAANVFDITLKPHSYRVIRLSP